MFSLPYTQDAIAYLLSHKGEVDMSTTHFEQNEQSDVMRSTFLYLRNTNLDVSLNFSYCTNEQKVSYVKGYLMTDIDFPHTDFYKLIMCYINTDIHEIIILKKVLSNVLNFLITQIQESSQITQNWKETDDMPLGINYINLLSFPAFEPYWLSQQLDTPLLYSGLFLRDKDKLLYTLLSNTAVAPALYLLRNTTSKEREIMFNALSDVTT